MKKFISKVFYKVDRKLGIIMSVLFVLSILTNTVSGVIMANAVAKSALFVICFYALFSVAYFVVICSFRHDDLYTENK